MTEKLAPLTQDYLDSLIVKEQYHAYEGTAFTTCLLHLTNGVKVQGTYDGGSTYLVEADVCRQFARSNAMTKLWELEGYLWRQRLHEEAQRDNHA